MAWEDDHSRQNQSHTEAPTTDFAEAQKIRDLRYRMVKATSARRQLCFPKFFPKQERHISKSLLFVQKRTFPGYVIRIALRRSAVRLRLAPQPKSAPYDMYGALFCVYRQPYCFFQNRLFNNSAYSGDCGRPFRCKAATSSERSDAGLIYVQSWPDCSKADRSFRIDSPDNARRYAL